MVGASVVAASVGAAVVGACFKLDEHPAKIVAAAIRPQLKAKTRFFIVKTPPYVALYYYFLIP